MIYDWGYRIYELDKEYRITAMSMGLEGVIAPMMGVMGGAATLIVPGSFKLIMGTATLGVTLPLLLSFWWDWKKMKELELKRETLSNWYETLYRVKSVPLTGLKGYELELQRSAYEAPQQLTIREKDEKVGRIAFVEYEDGYYITAIQGVRGKKPKWIRGLRDYLKQWDKPIFMVHPKHDAFLHAPYNTSSRFAEGVFNNLFLGGISYKGMWGIYGLMGYHFLLNEKNLEDLKRLPKHKGGKWVKSIVERDRLVVKSL